MKSVWTCDEPAENYHINLLLPLIFMELYSEYQLIVCNFTVCVQSQCCRGCSRQLFS